MNLFNPTPDDAAAQASQAPLADRMRPRALDEFVGQEHLLGPGKPLSLAIAHDDPTSMIFWGPPGTGKTTLAKIIAALTQATFIEFSAVMSGIKEIKQVMVAAEKAAGFRSRTILFIDEIHRFNKAQQDAFLPYVERGAIRLIGATTENPSFELIAALLSRCRVYTLLPLTEAQIVVLLHRALSDSARGLGASGVSADEDALATIASYASGDARNALNALDVAANLAGEAASPSHHQRDCRRGPAAARPALRQAGRAALRHHLRAAQVRAQLRRGRLALLAGAHVAGRRRPHVRCPPHRAHGGGGRWTGRARGAQPLPLRARCHALPRPAGRRSRAGAGHRLPGARAQVERGLHRLQRRVGDIEATAAEPVPLHLRNAPTKLMKSLDYGKGYQYAHNVEGRVADMECLPPSLAGRRYYHPTQEGREKLLAQRMDEVARIRQGKRKPK